MVGAVGEDVFGQALLDNLAHAGVGYLGRRARLRPLRRCSDPGGRQRRNCIVVVPGANGKVDSRPSTAMPR